jgi:hypothetical protein
MVAARNDFLSTESLATFDDHQAFAGEWHLDRISGLVVDKDEVTIRRLRIDDRALHVEVRWRGSEAPQMVTVDLQGGAAELRDGARTCNVQTLLEGESLVWELEWTSPERSARVRRVMRSSKQGSQLIAERVDLSEAGTPIALQTEYWTRAAGRENPPA